MTNHHAESLLIFLTLVGTCVVLVAVYDLARWHLCGVEATITFAIRAMNARFPGLRWVLWAVFLLVLWLLDCHLFQE